MIKPPHTPESQGIPSVSLNNFLARLEERQIPMHSVLVGRHGHLVFEGYYAPYEKTTLHRMFSVSKSMTSIAIGLLASEGKLTLDDPIIQHFPEYTPNPCPPYLASMTIRNMLTMETCHTSTTYKLDMTTDWVESFFTTKPSHRPGSVYNYDTSASHTLCALVEKITSKSQLDYLKEKSLTEIGFSKESHMLEDPFGISMGGSGLMATPMDMYLFADLIMKKGNSNGKQLLPSAYIEQAIKHHSDTCINMPIKEERVGYGYQFWRITHNGYACYGMGGQLAICLPDYDLLIVTTADTQGLQGGNQAIYDAVYEEILPYLNNSPLPEDSSSIKGLAKAVASLKITPLNGELSSPIMDDINGRNYVMDSNSQGFESFSVQFDRTVNSGILNFRHNSVDYQLPFGFGHTMTDSFPMYDQRYTASAAWLKDTTLYIKCHIIDTAIGSVHFHLNFMEDGLSVYMKKIEESLFGEFNGYLEGR